MLCSYMACLLIFPSDLLWCSLSLHSLPSPNVYVHHQYSNTIVRSFLELYLQNAQRCSTSAHYHRTSAHCHRTDVHRHSFLHRIADLLLHIFVVSRCLHLTSTHAWAISFLLSSLYIATLCSNFFFLSSYTT